MEVLVTASVDSRQARDTAVPIRFGLPLHDFLESPVDGELEADRKRANDYQQFAESEGESKLH